MIRDVELIKTEMQRVEEKVNRSRDLILSLAVERQRWEASKSTFSSQLSTLGGDSLVCAAFLAYSGYFDHRGRRGMLSEWRALLEGVNVKINREASLVGFPCLLIAQEAPVKDTVVLLLNCSDFLAGCVF